MKRAALTALFLMAVPALLAQTTGAALAGRVTDDHGTALRGVEITVTNAATGFSRSTLTAEDGSYRFPSLPAGVYGVDADLAGFTSVTTRSVELNVATERELNIRLRQAAVQEQITVTAQVPLVEATPAVSLVVSRRQMENLPLNGRQFANLGSLAPGTTLSVNADPTKPGQLTIALNGGSGRNVNFVIDGGDNTDDTIGGALQNFNIDAVDEFTIQTQQFKAEYGRTSGGVLTVVTKSGTNNLAGSAYEFFRDRSLNAATEHERDSGRPKSPYRRDQFGASLGGPIVKDRAHFFVTGERTDRRTSYVIDTDPDGPNQPKAPIYPELQGGAVTTPFKDDLVTAKASGDITDHQFLQLRYGYQRNSDKYGASPLVLPSALGTITNDYHSALVSHTWQTGPDKLNELLLQDTHFKNAITADSNDPTLIYPSGVMAGQSINAPQSTVQVKRQLKDDFAWSRSWGGMRHDLKAGANFIDEPVLGADFSTGLAGQYTLADDVRGAPVTEINVFGGFFGERTPIKQYSGYAQDDIAVNHKLTLNVGLRYDLWTGFDLDQTSNPIWKALSTQTKYSESYLKDFQGGRGGKLKNDRKNWGPRFGFSYDLNASGKNIVRGGYGRFHDFPYTNSTILFPAAAVQSDYGVIYHLKNPAGIRNADGSLYRPGQPLPPNGLPGGVQPPNDIASPTLATPRSDQFSIGYSWQLNPWLALNIDGTHIEYRDLPFRFRANPIDPATGAPRFPQFGNFRIWYGRGSARYNGMSISGRVRLGDWFELQGFYTLSEARGNVLAGADEFRITDPRYQPDLAAVRDQSINPLNPLCAACSGPLDTDARHRTTISGMYRGPWDITLAGLLRFHSATPYTDWSGVDLNGDGYAFDLPSGVTRVNSLRGQSFSQFDLRVAKTFKFADKYGLDLIAEVFNVLNVRNAVAFQGNRFILAPDPSNPDKTIVVPNPGYQRAKGFAGDPGQGEQRLAQLGIRMTF